MHLYVVAVFKIKYKKISQLQINLEYCVKYKSMVEQQ